jgi:hypothetical protein
MIEEFHPYEGCEPGWGFGEEFVPVGGYVEGAQLMGEVGYQVAWLEGDRVDEEYYRNVRGEED